MRVVAIAPGYDGQYRNIGDQFDAPDKAVATWFKPVTKSALAEAADLRDKTNGTPEPKALSEIKTEHLV